MVHRATIDLLDLNIVAIRDLCMLIYMRLSIASYYTQIMSILDVDVESIVFDTSARLRSLFNPGEFSTDHA